MRYLIVIMVMAAALGPCAAAQTRGDTVKIFVWDNDAGEAAQEQPALMMNPESVSYTVWSDLRDGNWNIYGQRTDFDGAAIGNNFLVNSDPSASWGLEKNPDISGYSTASNRFAVVWQDSMASGNWRIYGRLFTAACEPTTADLLLSKSGTAPKFRPRVAMRLSTGFFVVVWMQYRTINNIGDIFIRLFDPSGAAVTDTIRVNSDTTRLQRRPCVAFNDVGVVVAWEDWRNGSFPVIRGQKYDPGLGAIGTNFTISNTDYYADSPDIDAIDGSDFYMVTWNSRQPLTARNIRACRFSFSTGMIDQEFIVNPVALLGHSYNPTIAVFPAGDAAVAWQDSVTVERAAETYVRYCFPYTATLDTGNYFLANEQFPRNQEYPVIANYGNEFAVAWHDSVRPTGRGDVFGQNGYVATSASPDTIAKFHPNYRIDNLASSGRKVWYRPRKNYDNPITPWNEDPIAEPDSLYIPLDSAFVRAFAERNNVPGQSFVRITDSPELAEGFHDDRKSAINGGDYDACVMDLGYATASLSAGEISDAQQDSLKAFADSGGALLCSGNDFGEMYNGTALFGAFGATYAGPGNPTANIDSLGGTHEMTDGMQFKYPYGGEEDRSVDYIVPDSAGCNSIMESDPLKWARCRGTFYSSYFKGPKAAWHRRNVYLAFAMGALKSDGVYPSTQAELSRRILAYQGFNVEPSPVHNLAATSASEGQAAITWTAPCDDAIAESTSAYQLKYSWYNEGAADLGRLSSESDYCDSGHVYYQTWAPKAPGGAESRTLYGLPPGDTLILAMKARDESTPRRWSELGNEPRVVVAGDRVTPHTIGMSYGYGCVRDFIGTELIETRNDDTLFCTWNTFTVYFGYSRCDWRTTGDLLIYMDTRDGGADSTVDYNGSGIKSGFDSGRDFKPDFCLVFETESSYTIKKWDSSGKQWMDTLTVPSAAYASLDSINGYTYAELRVPFTSIGSYDTTRVFRYLAVAQQETSNDPWNAFPALNGLTKASKAPNSYGYYYQVDNGLRSGLEPRGVSGILAVELAEFSAQGQPDGVTLTWRTGSETDNYQWLIHRSTAPDAGYVHVASIPSQGSSPTGHVYTYLDNAVLPNTTYYYLLGDQDAHENVVWHGPVSVTTAGSGPTRLELSPCRPNPASGPVTIRCSVPAPGRVRLQVYDICGRLVRTIMDGVMMAGTHLVPWDAKDDSGREIATGVYFYRLSTGGQQVTRKMTMLR